MRSGVNMEKVSEIAVFHDIGKIVNWAALGFQARDNTGQFSEREPHDFEKCKGNEWGVDFSSPIWEAIYRKDKDVLESNYPGSVTWLITRVADQLAAGLGRGPGEEQFQGTSLYGRYSLWKGQAGEDLRLSRIEELRELIQLMNSNPLWDEAVRRYGALLSARAETARPGLNVTSLYAHSVATAKLASVLDSALLALVPPTTSFNTAFETIKNVKLVVALIEVGFVQQPFRTRDLFVIKERRRKIAELVRAHHMNVLASFGESLLLIFPSASELDRACGVIAEEGFNLTVQKEEWSIDYLKNWGVDKVLDRERTRFGPDPPDQILPPICEVCEMAAGTLRWPADYLLSRGDLQGETISLLRSRPLREIKYVDIPESDQPKLGEWIEEWSEEYLCGQCFSLRRNAQPLSKLKEWREGVVAWVHIHLSFGDLNLSLEKLQAEYARQALGGPLPAGSTLPVRIPILVDFTADFDAFLEAWRNEVVSHFGAERVEQVDGNILCVKLLERREALLLLMIHSRLMGEFFPKLVDTGSKAIRIAVSTSSPKHPFFAHWRFLERPASAVCVQLVEAGQASIPLNRLRQTLKIVEEGNRGAYHRLRKIVETSRKLAELVMSDVDDRDRSLFEQLRKIMPLGIDFESLMTLANLAER